MAWSLRVALLVAALAHAVAEADPSCSASEPSCEQEEVGMLQSSATQSTQSMSMPAAPSRGPGPAGPPAHSSEPVGPPPSVGIAPGLKREPSRKAPPVHPSEPVGPPPSTAQVMLTIRRGTVRKESNLTDVWNQMMGSVEIDQVTAMLKEAHGNLKEELTKKLDELKEAFPAAAEIQEKFKGKWDEITKGVNVDELKSMVEDAKKNGGAKLEELQGKLEDALKGVDVEGIKKQTQDMWTEYSANLPNMDDLKANLDKYSAQAQVAWNDFSKSDEWSQVTDAANQAANAAKGAWDTATGWFR